MLNSVMYLAWMEAIRGPAGSSEITAVTLPGPSTGLRLTNRPWAHRAMAGISPEGSQIERLSLSGCNRPGSSVREILATSPEVSSGWFPAINVWPSVSLCSWVQAMW